MWLATCGLLRAGEFVQKPTTKYSLKLQHLTFHDARNNILDPHHLHGETPIYMSLKLYQSKTDPFRKGTNVIIGNPQAIEYMLAYLHHRNQLAVLLGAQPFQLLMLAGAYRLFYLLALPL